MVRAKKQTNPKKNLWFVNIGGYSPTIMQEKHEFGLVVASNTLEAKKIAMSKWLIGCEKKHKDNISSLKKLNESGTTDNKKVSKMIPTIPTEYTANLLFIFV